jgi:hypothetical protein
MLIRRSFKNIGSHSDVYAFLGRNPKRQRQLHQDANIQADVLFSLQIKAF